MNRRVVLLLAACCWTGLLRTAQAQEAPPTLYPINAKTEPLLASIKRLNLFAKGEEAVILAVNPARPDHPVCRLDKEGRTARIDKLPGAQVRLGYTIAAGVSEEEKLDAKAKKELAAAIASYKLHTFDDTGRIIRSRLPKNEDEALRQINLDVDGAHHFRKVAAHAKKLLKGE